MSKFLIILEPGTRIGTQNIHGEIRVWQVREDGILQVVIGPEANDDEEPEFQLEVTLEHKLIHRGNHNWGCTNEQCQWWAIRKPDREATRSFEEFHAKLEP